MQQVKSEETEAVDSLDAQNEALAELDSIITPSKQQPPQYRLFTTFSNPSSPNNNETNENDAKESEALINENENDLDDDDDDDDENERENLDDLERVEQEQNEDERSDENELDMNAINALINNKDVDANSLDNENEDENDNLMDENENINIMDNIDSTNINNENKSALDALNALDLLGLPNNNNIGNEDDLNEQEKDDSENAEFEPGTVENDDFGGVNNIDNNEFEETNLNENNISSNIAQMIAKQPEISPMPVDVEQDETEAAEVASDIMEASPQQQQQHLSEEQANLNQRLLDLGINMDTINILTKQLDSSQMLQSLSQESFAMVEKNETGAISNGFHNENDNDMNENANENENDPNEMINIPPPSMADDNDDNENGAINELNNGKLEEKEDFNENESDLDDNDSNMNENDENLNENDEAVDEVPNSEENQATPPPQGPTRFSMILFCFACLLSAMLETVLC